MTTGIVKTETIHALAFVVSEQDHFMSREAVTIDQSQAIVPGQVLGRTTVTSTASAVATANAGNTGNGTLALASPAVDTSVKEGAYKVVYTDATHFLVEDPDGVVLGEGVNGSAFAKGVKFTITAGGTAFVAGDGFTVQATVVATDERYVAHNPAATDGSQKAAAIACYPVTTGAGATAKTTVMRRICQVRASDLTFAAGITAAQTAQLRKDLADRNIILR